MRARRSLGSSLACFFPRSNVDRDEKVVGYDWKK